jgi:hypothetical protein
VTCCSHTLTQPP